MPVLEEREAGCQRCQAWTQVVCVGKGHYDHRSRTFQEAVRLCGPCFSALLTGLVDLLTPTLTWVDGKGTDATRVQALERKVGALEVLQANDHTA